MKKRAAIAIGAAAAGVAVFAGRELYLSSQEELLLGQVVLITGGSRGLGLALARELVRDRCKLAICARDQEELDRAVTDLNKRGAEVFSVRCDVTQQSEVEGMIRAVTEHYGRIDILINNAGVIQVGPVQSLDVSDFQQAMNVIFWGTVYPTLAVLPKFLERKSGKIVNISSIGGKMAVPHLVPYASAKFAVAGFSQGLAAELRPQGVTVTAIYPGLMRTGSFVQAQFKGDQKKEGEWFTLGASLPGMSMNAGRAARQIVRAIKRGETERVLSFPAQAASRFNSLFPGGASELLSAAASVLLPSPRSGSAVKKGWTLFPKMHPAVRVLSTLGVRAMRNLNQRT